MEIKKMTEFLKVLATLPDNEQEKVLAYAQVFLGCYNSSSWGLADFFKKSLVITMLPPV